MRKREKWVVKSSLAAITRQSGKIRLSEWKNNNFVTIRRLSPNREELDGGGAHVGHVSRSFILKSTQQEEALHRIWYTLRR
ncbi:unnamed protein product [Spirodela intermedia]|uniref:Uncharacterized protein n=1 Tax=Spirodela intermedia TaxID=51605 RepID=A0A7I8KYF6_SPIIN|nr:unnamed protein product [Spirodela intermedia]